MLYKVIFNNVDESDYFLNESLIFRVKRKRLLIGYRSINKVYDNNKLLFSFSTSEFTFLHWKVKIISQDLEKIITLKKSKRKHILCVDKNELSLKFTSNPFNKKVAIIFFNNEEVGEINQKVENSKFTYLFNFNKNITGFEYYFMILFSIYSVGITDNE